MPSSSPTTAEVSVVDDAFSPSTAIVPAGATVTWTNRGGPHTVTFDALPIDRVLAEGGAFSERFDAVGTYAYVCRFHDEMRGSVQVVERGAEPAAAPQLGGPGITLDEGHYDERPVEVRHGTPVLFNNPRDEEVTIEFRDGAPLVVVPVGGSVPVHLPVGEHWWRESEDAASEWRADDHDVGVIRVSV